MLINSVELNFIKLYTTSNFGTYEGNTYISLGENFIKDVVGNPSQAKEGLMASKFVPDATPPVVTSFSLDLDSGTLLIVFSEPVFMVTLDLTAIRLQDHETFLNSTYQYTLTGGLILTPGLSTYAFISLSENDLSNIVAFVGVNQTYLYLSAEDGIVIDAVGNPAMGISDYAALLVNKVILQTPPRLLTSHLNISNSYFALTMSFSETVSLKQYINISVTDNHTTSVQLPDTSKQEASDSTVVVTSSEPPIDLLILNGSLYTIPHIYIDIENPTAVVDVVNLQLDVDGLQAVSVLCKFSAYSFK